MSTAEKPFRLSLADHTQLPEHDATHVQIRNFNVPRMRWFDAEGNMLLTGHEMALVESDRADLETSRADRLAAQLRALGLEPEA